MHEELIALAKKMALDHQLDPALVCAVIEQESAWNPWAMRYELAFFVRNVAPFCADSKISATEARTRAFSCGLMQVMGQVARENGFDGTLLSALCDPEQGIAVGCRVLARKRDSADGDVALAWNGGGNPLYAEQVLARLSHFAGKE